VGERAQVKSRGRVYGRKKREGGRERDEAGQSKEMVISERKEERGWMGGLGAVVR
jgi:hypothetical protein